MKFQSSWFHLCPVTFAGVTFFYAPVLVCKEPKVIVCCDAISEMLMHLSLLRQIRHRRVSINRILSCVRVNVVILMREEARGRNSITIAS